jgi:hypothetical protein
MKLLTLALLSVLAIPTQPNEKITLFCQKWKQVGLKQFRGKYLPITRMPKIMTLRMDGTYEETYGTLRSKGNGNSALILQNLLLVLLNSTAKKSVMRRWI